MTECTLSELKIYIEVLETAKMTLSRLMNDEKKMYELPETNKYKQAFYQLTEILCEVYDVAEEMEENE